MSNLEAYLSHTKLVLKALAKSQEIRDRGSIFVAALYRAADPVAARNAHKYHREVVHSSNSASHEICAWRCMVLKHGRDGLSGPDDFEVRGGSDDDGEQWGGARVLKTMQGEGVLDAVVIVSRWYGGTMLGPARFAHIETCTREVCRTFKLFEEVEGCIAGLTHLDDELASLRTELAGLTPVAPSADAPGTGTPPVPKVHDYSALLCPPDPQKAKRLLTARRNAVQSVKSLISSKRAKQPPVGADDFLLF